jgi:hypothetical protein
VPVMEPVTVGVPVLGVAPVAAAEVLRLGDAVDPDVAPALVASIDVVGARAANARWSGTCANWPRAREGRRRAARSARTMVLGEGM